MEDSSKEIKYNKDEETPPDFLNQDFFESVLQKAENDSTIKITSLRIVPGTKAGDHFLSIMFRATVSYTSEGKDAETRSLIVKTVPVDDGTKKEMIKEMPVFVRETQFYTEVLPDMVRLMESIGDDEKIAPRLIHHGVDPAILIFEDIAVHGYEMNKDFYDFDNTVKVVLRLAKFHALSFYINDNKYNFYADFTKFTPMINRSVTEKMKVFFEGFDYVAEEAKNWPGFEGIAKKLSEQSDTFVEKLLKVYQPNAEFDFKVLCHGDYHIKNMMFIKNGGNIEKTMLLDYQLCFWTSPAYDLIYLLYAFGDTSCRKRRNEIILIYYKFFKEYLNRLGCLTEPPTLLQLNMDMLRMGVIEILWSICYLPFFSLDFSKVDAETTLNPTPEAMRNMRKIMYKNEKLVALLKDVLPELLHKGILS